LSVDPDADQSLRGQAVEWLMRLQEAPQDARLRADLDDWLAQSDDHRRAYEDMKVLWGHAEAVGARRAAGADGSHAPRTFARTRKRGAQTRKRAWVTAAGLALAASLALFVLPRAQLWWAADHQTGTAELRDVVLDDGSRMTLDARTAVSVDYTATQRTVNLLSGQAFFDVTPSRERPFVVKAEEVSVRVTGTSFGVETSGAGVTVAVRSGAVTVSERSRGTVADLKAGQKVRVSPQGTPTSGTLMPDDVAAWRDRRLVVYDAPIRDVVDQIARHTGTIIVFGDSRIADQTVTATIDLRHPDEALRTVVGLKYGRVMELSPYLAVISSR
jgi:transmembrane sensor